MSFLKLFSKFITKTTNTSTVDETIQEVPVTINVRELSISFQQDVQDFSDVCSAVQDKDDFFQEAVDAAVDEVEFPLNCPQCKREHQATVGSLDKQRQVLCICRKVFFTIHILR